MKETWTVLEESVKNNSVKMIGLCDVDTQLFIQLYSWANIKPSIVQINLASCCVVPPELAEFCKENGIQLLTHSDPISKNLDFSYTKFFFILMFDDLNITLFLFTFRYFA